jgi:serine phosphatase RsbU (regulator of sigma subunit)
MCIPFERDISRIAGAICVGLAKPVGESDVRHAENIVGQIASGLELADLREMSRQYLLHEIGIGQIAHIVREFLPSKQPVVDGYAFDDFHSPALPRGFSGDFFDYVETPDGRLAIIVGDVAGHRPGAAVMQMRIAGQLRCLIRSGSSPEAALRIVNDELHLGNRTFMSITVALLDPVKGEIEILNAGNPPFLLNRSQGAGEGIRTSVTGLPLGIFPADEALTVTSYDMACGDCLVLYTYGVIGACSESDDFYGLERLTKRFEMLVEDPSRMVSGIVEDLQQFTGPTPTQMCIVSVSRTSP